MIVSKSAMWNLKWIALLKFQYLERFGHVFMSEDGHVTEMF